MNQRQKILVVIPRMPFPVNSGGRVAIFGTLQILVKYFDLYIVAVDDNQIYEEQKEVMKSLSVKFYYFTYPKSRFYFNSLKSIFNDDSLQVNYFYFNEVQKLVDELSIEVDFAFVFMSRMAKYLFNFKKPVVFNAIDSMYLNYQKSIKKTKSLLWKTIYWIEIKRLFAIEKYCVENFALSYFVNIDEANYWKKYSNTVTSIPFSGDDKLLDVTETSDDFKQVILFVGRMDYRPNIDAVIWFIENVFPLVYPELEFWIIGGFVTNEIKKITEKHSRIKLKGYVEYPEITIRSALCNIAPMQTGGGLQTKIVTAMALEGLVIGTSISVQALPEAQDNVNVLLENDPKSFANKINLVYDAPLKYNIIRENARALIREKYSWNAVENLLLDNFDKYLKTNLRLSK